MSAVPFGPGTDIWRSLLPGGLGRFVPCSIGANHCRLRHVGWETCGHGLNSKPRESASVPFLNELLILFNYPPGSARALLAGTLPLRYYATRFASRTPTWRLPVPGHVAGLVAGTSWEVQEVVAEGAIREVHWVSGSGPGRKRIRLNRKPPAHLAGCPISATCLEEIASCGDPFVFLFLMGRGGDAIRMMWGTFLLRSGLGWDNSLGFVLAHVSRFARF